MQQRCHKYRQVSAALGETTAAAKEMGTAITAAVMHSQTTVVYVVAKVLGNVTAKEELRLAKMALKQSAQATHGNVFRFLLVKVTHQHARMVRLQTASTMAGSAHLALMCVVRRALIMITAPAIQTIQIAVGAAAAIPMVTFVILTHVITMSSNVSAAMS